MWNLSWSRYEWQSLGNLGASLDPFSGRSGVGVVMLILFFLKSIRHQPEALPSQVETPPKEYHNLLDSNKKLWYFWCGPLGFFNCVEVTEVSHESHPHKIVWPSQWSQYFPAEGSVKMYHFLSQAGHAIECQGSWMCWASLKEPCDCLESQTRPRGSNFLETTYRIGVHQWNFTMSLKKCF